MRFFIDFLFIVAIQNYARVFLSYYYYYNFNYCFFFTKFNINFIYKIFEGIFDENYNNSALDQRSISSYYCLLILSRLFDYFISGKRDDRILVVGLRSCKIE